MTAPTPSPEIGHVGEAWGWALFDSTGSENGCLQIQGFDEDGVPDEAGWDSAVYLAMHGSEDALDVFDQLTEHNPLELHCILHWLAGWEPPDPSKHKH